MVKIVLMSARGDVRLVNSYGPTEATIVTTTVDLSSLTSAELSRRSLPIGNPIRNATIYVLDPFLQPVPIGVPGELYIGGIGVASGYLNRPDLTAKAFIPDPFSPSPKARLYKTGDRVRYWDTGMLEFLGRIDNQVKIRGFRIELGEIEAMLGQHPDVQDCVVIDRETLTGDIQLVAYVVPTRDQTLQPPNLRRFLEKKLPKYMVPTAFMPLDTIPHNTNGKVDRQALSIPITAKPDVTTARTETEIEIARIFAAVLQVGTVGIYDDFFELGGHSLLATKLIARLFHLFQVELSIADLFENPSVVGLAEQIEKRANLARQAPNDNHSLDIQLHSVERTPDLQIPLSFSQQYLWDIHHSSYTKTTLNSSITLRVKGDLTPKVVEQSFNELVCRHEILRTVFKPVEGQPTQVIFPTLHVPLLYLDLQSVSPNQRESEAFAAVLNVAQPAFDLASAPLIRIALLRLDSQEYWLLITMHHMITDGWSFGLLLHELNTLVQSFSQDLPSPLPEVSLHYADFALWQRQVYDETAISQQLNYWAHKLIGKVPDELFPLPESPESDRFERHANHFFTTLPASLMDKVEALSRSLSVTHFVVLLAALNLTLAVWSGEQDIWLVTTVGNRAVPETEQMMGCFINDVIVRSQLCLEKTGTLLIQQVHAEVQAAIEHKEVPIGWVIEQTKRFRPINFMGSVTITPSAQIEIPGWEVIDIQTKKQHLDNLSSELFTLDIPLELYIEVSKPVKIIAKYSAQQFTEEAIEQLFICYQAVLTGLVMQPQTPLWEFYDYRPEDV